MQVPGARPLARWGAAMTLDSSGVLFVTGGATYDATNGSILNPEPYSYPVSLTIQTLHP